MASIQTLLIGENAFPFHRLDEMGPAIETALGEESAVTTTTDTRELTDLGSYDAVADYLGDSFLPAEQLEGLRSFVANGGGYLGIHCAADLTSANDGEGGIDHQEEPVPELRELLGGHFLDHPEQSEFGVEVVAEHPVTAGVEDFTVFDEPYQVTTDDVEVLARMDHPDGGMEDYPVVWVREFGDGRVCYVSLGHTEESLETEGCRRLLENGLRWVARE